MKPEPVKDIAYWRRETERNLRSAKSWLVVALVLSTVNLALQTWRLFR